MREVLTSRRLLQLSRDWSLYRQEKDIEICFKAAQDLVEWMKREKVEKEAAYLTSDLSKRVPSRKVVE